MITFYWFIFKYKCHGQFRLRIEEIFEHKQEHKRRSQFHTLLHQSCSNNLSHRFKILLKISVRFDID